jgi:c-di-GMP-binding flagellar brake protein YcgR
MVERRRYRRFKIRLLVVATYQDKTGKIIVEDAVFSEDIGGGGIRLVFPRLLAKEKILELKVYLFSDSLHLPTKGKVIWTKAKNMQELELVANSKQHKSKKQLFWLGIQFVNIDTFTQQRLLNWIKREFNVKEA